MAKVLELSELDNQSAEIKEAIAFYTAYTILPVYFRPEERERHYSVLQQAGYIEKVGDLG